MHMHSTHINILSFVIHVYYFILWTWMISNLINWLHGETYLLCIINEAICLRLFILSCRVVPRKWLLSQRQHALSWEYCINVKRFFLFYAIDTTSSKFTQKNNSNHDLQNCFHIERCQSQPLGSLYLIHRHAERRMLVAWSKT